MPLKKYTDEYIKKYEPQGISWEEYYSCIRKKAYDTIEETKKIGFLQKPYECKWCKKYHLARLIHSNN